MDSNIQRNKGVRASWIWYAGLEPVVHRDQVSLRSESNSRTLMITAVFVYVTGRFKVRESVTVYITVVDVVIVLISI